jgi:hypothetical protein
MNFLKTSKSKLVAGTSAVLVSTQAFSAVAYDTATGAFTGTIEMGGYTSAVVIVVGVIGLVVATALGIKALKGAKSA